MSEDAKYTGTVSCYISLNGQYVCLDTNQEGLCLKPLNFDEIDKCKSNYLNMIFFRKKSRLVVPQALLIWRNTLPILNTYSHLGLGCFSSYCFSEIQITTKIKG